jgi:hypothetical protein
MNYTPADIAASISENLDYTVQTLFHRYIAEHTLIRHNEFSNYMAEHGVSTSPDDMLRLLSTSPDYLFTEGSDDRGRFFKASIMPNAQSNEGYIDHRITDRVDQFGDEFTDTDMAGINGQIDQEDSGFGGDMQAQPMMDRDVDDGEKPGMIPMDLPQMVSQAMDPDGYGDEYGHEQQGQPIEQRTDTGRGTIGPGEEMQMQQTPQFGDDGTEYTIDPFLNAMGGPEQEEQEQLPQNPQTSNMPATGASTKLQQRYSPRMREAMDRRQSLNG